MNIEGDGNDGKNGSNGTSASHTSHHSHTSHNSHPFSDTADVLRCDVCVFGVGSGGFGAALAAARNGARVIAIEKNQVVGGTTTMAWVHVWQPVLGGGPFPKELWERMSALPGGTDGLPYSAGEPETCVGKQMGFEPWAFDWVVRQMLLETGNCDLHLGTSLTGVDAVDGRIRSVTVGQPGNMFRVTAKQYIDCTADGDLCVLAGCDYRIGEDARSEFGESLAPEEPVVRLNPSTLIYRVRDMGEKQVPWLPRDTAPDHCTGEPAWCGMANGDRLINRCGMIEGNMLDVAYRHRILHEARRMVHAHLYWLQTEGGLPTWGLAGIAPEIGVRESRRIMGEYIMTELDCTAGLKGQDHPDIVVIADHTLDLHNSFDLPVTNGPYGIPFRCLRPKGFDNLLIASRAASFSHIAASACRLQRTIMKMGEVAGTAAALAVSDGIDPGMLEIDVLKDRLSLQESALD